MKKQIGFIIAIAMLVFVLSSCSNNKEQQSAEEQDSLQVEQYLSGLSEDTSHYQISSLELADLNERKRDFRAHMSRLQYLEERYASAKRVSLVIGNIRNEIHYEIDGGQDASSSQKVAEARDYKTNEKFNYLIMPDSLLHSGDTLIGYIDTSVVDNSTIKWVIMDIETINGRKFFDM